MAHLTDDDKRLGFELAMTFGIEGVPQYAGCIVRLSSGQYADPLVQSAWLGYAEGVGAMEALASRSSPHRPIGQGSLTFVRELVTRPDATTEQIARGILAHFMGQPI